jgi:hypothetical protein
MTRMAFPVIAGALALAGCATRPCPLACVEARADLASAPQPAARGSHGFQAIGMNFVVRSGPENGPLPYPFQVRP